MQAQARTVVIERARDWALLPGAMLATAAVFAGLAGPSNPGRAAVSEGLARLLAAPPAATAPAEPLVLGADVDGDGTGDFVNPTGGVERGADAYGSGRFGAVRDGGVRRHEGADFVATPGQSVEAPITGYVSKIGYAYAGDSDLRFVEITNPHTRWRTRLFYVAPTVFVGERVALGESVGTAESLQRRYPGGITNHVHVELMRPDGRHVDPVSVVPVQGGLYAASGSNAG